jgi:hypothetical protein
MQLSLRRLLWQSPTHFLAFWRLQFVVTPMNTANVIRVLLTVSVPKTGAITTIKKMRPPTSTLVITMELVEPILDQPVLTEICQPASAAGGGGIATVLLAPEKCTLPKRKISTIPFDL